MHAFLNGIPTPVPTRHPSLRRMAVFFTADTHFGDAHILRWRGVRYASIEAHDAALIAGWNAAVGPDDTVWHLGDFAAHASRAYCAEVFARLNGIKRLVVGNHDTRRVTELPWAEVAPTARTTLVGPDGEERRLYLAHYAHRAWPGLWRGTRHLYGHTHASLPDTQRSCDVGVDAWADRPVALPAILARQDAARLVPEELARDAASLARGADPEHADDPVGDAG
jgi:calcineurin-like phosphoesterase family protein